MLAGSAPAARIHQSCGWPAMDGGMCAALPLCVSSSKHGRERTNTLGANLAGCLKDASGGHRASRQPRAATPPFALISMIDSELRLFQFKAQQNKYSAINQGIIRQSYCMHTNKPRSLTIMSCAAKKQLEPTKGSAGGPHCF